MGDPKPDERLAHAETLAEQTSPRTAPGQLARGDIVGRYLVLDHIASGGMGAVYRAYDPDLDRAIAVKLVRAASGRMMREAQALARLNHPNVITIYDVGLAADDVFLAMELVNGKTLRAWMAEPHPVAERLALLRDAGRGLAAAHAAGIVHRDIKPENVLVGDDGRVRVVDFGLAGAAGDEVVGASGDLGDSDMRRAAASFNTPLTRPGEMFGTPHYMAPEQFAGASVDARADQFAFCVTAYEALYGERPYEGDNLAALGANVATGERRPVPAGRGVPDAARDAILRGLSPEPDERHPSMSALLDALAPPAAPGRTARWPFLMLGAAMVAGGAIVAAAWLLRDEPRACSDGRARLSGAWDDNVRGKVRAAFDATRASYASAAFGRLEAALDGWADRWSAMRLDACGATQRGEQSSHLLDLRIACLDRRRDELAALTGALGGRLDAEALDRAVEAVEALPSLERCADGASLLSAPPLPTDPKALQAIDGVYASLDEMRVHDLLGDLEAARAAAERAAAQALAIDYPPLQTEALWWRSLWEDHVGELDREEATLTELVRIGTLTDDHDAMARAMLSLLWLAGSQRDRYAEADAYARLAAPLVERAGRDDLRAELLRNLGALALKRGDHAGARDIFDRAMQLGDPAEDVDQIAQLYSFRAQARGNLGDVDGAVADMLRLLELRRGQFGDDHPYVAAAHNNVALWLKAQARYDAALGHARQALAIMERRAPTHPHRGSTLHTLGLVLAATGEHAQALEHFERALPILRAAKSPDHPEVAGLLNSMGYELRALGRPADALARHQEALAVMERVRGADHPDTADTRISVGLALVALGRLDEGDAAYRRALATLEATVPATSPRLAIVLTNVGELALRRRAHREALAACTRALAIDEQNLGTTHPDLAYDLLCIAEAQGALHAMPDAIASAERAVRVRETAGGDPEELQDARDELARLRGLGGR